MTIGASSINPNAALEIKSSNGGLLLPRLSTQQRDALNAPEGLMIYNSDIGKFQGYAAGAATNFATSEVGSDTYTLEDDGSNVNYLAQTFTASSTGQVQRIEFNVSNFTPGYKVRAELYQGNNPGSGSFLAGQDFVVSLSDWNKVIFPSNPSVTAGQVYYIVIKPGEVSGDLLDVYTSDAGSPGQHPGGSMYLWNEGSGDFDISSGNDMDFRVISVASGAGWVNLH